MKNLLMLLAFMALLSGCSTVNIYENQGGVYQRGGVRVINPCTQGGCASMGCYSGINSCVYP